MSTPLQTVSTMAGCLATIEPIRSEQVRCPAAGTFGGVGQNSLTPSRLKMAGTSVRAARSMSVTPTISPGARVRSDSRLATSNAAKAAMTVAAAEVITTPTRVTEKRRLPLASSPPAIRSRCRNNKKTM